MPSLRLEDSLADDIAAAFVIPLPLEEATRVSSVNRREMLPALGGWACEPSEFLREALSRAMAIRCALLVTDAPPPREPIVLLPVCNGLPDLAVLSERVARELILMAPRDAEDESVNRR